jgi:hypothetical protein
MSLRRTHVLLQRAVQYLDHGHDVVKDQQVSCATASRIAYELGFTPFRKDQSSLRLPRYEGSTVFIKTRATMPP